MAATAVATAEGVVATAAVATAAGAVAVAAVAMAAGAVTPTVAEAGPVPATGRTVAAAAATGGGARIPEPAVRTVAINLGAMPMAGALRGAAGIAMPAAMRVRAMATPAAGSATRSPRLPPQPPTLARRRRRRPGSATWAKP